MSGKKNASGLEKTEREEKRIRNKKNETLMCIQKGSEKNLALFVLGIMV